METMRDEAKAGAKTGRDALRRLLASGFVRTSGVYVLGSAINSALPLLLMPVLTRYLTPHDYGVVAMGNMLLQVLILVQGLNGWGLVARTYFDKEPDALRRMLTANLAQTVVVTLALLAVSPFLAPLAEAAFRFPAAWFGGLLLLGLAAVLQLNYTTYLRNGKKAFEFITFEACEAITNLGLSLFLVVGLGMDWRGRFLAMLAVGMMVAVYCLLSFGRRFQLLGRKVYDREKLRELAAFGVPLIPHSIGGILLALLARLWLTHAEGLGSAGIYNVAFSLASPVLLLVGAFQKAFQPTLFEYLADEPRCDNVRLARALLLVMAGLVAGALAYGAFALLLLPLIVAPDFRVAGGPMVWLACACAAQGIYYIFANFVIFSKQTQLIAWRGDFLGAAVMIAMCAVLIPLNGVTGAAQAYLLAVTVSAAGCFTAARRAYPMPWRAGARMLAGDIAGLARRG